MIFIYPDVSPSALHSAPFLWGSRSDQRITRRCAWPANTCRWARHSWEHCWEHCWKCMKMLWVNQKRLFFAVRQGGSLVELVGGLEHEFYDFPYIGNNHPNWLSYFSEGLKPPIREASCFLFWICNPPQNPLPVLFFIWALLAGSISSTYPHICGPLFERTSHIMGKNHENH